MINKTWSHFTQAGHQERSDPAEWEKLQGVDMEVHRVDMYARKIDGWKGVLMETEVATATNSCMSQRIYSVGQTCTYVLQTLMVGWSKATSLVRLLAWLI
jgi:hypothetical protein